MPINTSKQTDTRGFPTSSMTLAPILAAATLLLTPVAATAAQPSANCSVEVNYVVNGTLTEAYTRDFTVTGHEPFVDDFSTPTREKRFTATLARDAGKLAVSIDYFNDVGVFVAISLDTSVRVRGAGVIESTSGSNTFSSSQAIPAGNHTTEYTLVCHRS